MDITFNIPEAKIDEYVDHYIYVHENIELNDPSNPKSGPKYNDRQWVKEHIIKYVKQQIIRGRNAKYHDDIVSYTVDDIA